MNIVERLSTRIKVNEKTGCWEWTGCLHECGYGLDGKRNRRVHRLVYTVCFGQIPKGMRCCHSCDNPACCNPYHLFLGTPRDNTQDAVRKGRLAKGESHGRAKLTEESVRTIFKLREKRALSVAEMATMFNVRENAIYRVLHRETWSHVSII